jgi:membrane-associated HD superfamily phosphohydrolase
MRKNNPLIGLLISVITCGILIFSFEKEFSFLQIMLGFGVYILPSIFVTSFQSKLTVFIISTTTILLGYFSFKNQFYEIWVGVLLALLIGRTINFYKITIT